MPLAESEQKDLNIGVVGRREEAFKDRNGTLGNKTSSSVSPPAINLAIIVPGAPARKTLLGADSCLRHPVENSGSCRD